MLLLSPYCIGFRLLKPGDEVEEPSELLWSGGDISKTRALRPRIFWIGLIGSSVLTILPAILVPAAWAIFGFH